MSSEVVMQVIALFGAYFLLVAFALLKFNIVSANNRYFNALNAIGGILLLINAVYYWSYGFIVLNTVFTALSIWSLILSAKAQPKKPAKRSDL